MKSSIPELSKELKHLLQETERTCGEKSDELSFLIELATSDRTAASDCVCERRYSTLVVRRA